MGQSLPTAPLILLDLLLFGGFLKYDFPKELLMTIVVWSGITSIYEEREREREREREALLFFNTVVNNNYSSMRERERERERERDSFKDFFEFYFDCRNDENNI